MNGETQPNAQGLPGGFKLDDHQGPIYERLKRLVGHEKQKLFHFIFERKLAYSQKNGYRTNDIPIATRLFEEFTTKQSDDVEAGGVEPPSGMCQPNFLQA